jgi:RNase H-fold protein (predicted Holliday junction resolvase)
MRLSSDRRTALSVSIAYLGAGLTHKKRRTRRDQVAAQLILQAFLDVQGE